MKFYRWILTSLVMVFGVFESSGAAPADPVLLGQIHTNAYAIFRYDWQDERRQRPVPVTIYFPKTKTNAVAHFPMVIFSHGLGGSREGYDYLGRYWAAHGLVSVHIQHLGTDTSIWQDMFDGGPQGAMRRAVGNLQNLIDRPLDASFAITRMLELNRDKTSPFFDRLDPGRIGMAGHSLGAFTTLALAGQSFPPVSGRTNFFGDVRVKAAIPMSASMPTDRRNLDQTYGRIHIPCLHMTGTEDDSPLGETSASERRVPYDHSKHSDQYLVTFNGADHMMFAGLNNLNIGGPNDLKFQKWICVSSTIFWNAYLRNDAASREWLVKNFPTELGNYGKVESKVIKQPAE